MSVIAGCGGRKRYIILYGEKVKRKKMEKSVFCSLLWPRHWVEGLLSAAARIGVHTAWHTMSLGGKICPFQGRAILDFLAAMEVGLRGRPRGEVG
jgi:hypothetical protein